MALSSPKIKLKPDKMRKCHMAVSCLLKCTGWAPLRRLLRRLLAPLRALRLVRAPYGPYKAITALMGFKALKCTGWAPHLSFWKPSRRSSGESWGDSRGDIMEYWGLRPPLFGYAGPLLRVA